MPDIKQDTHFMPGGLVVDSKKDGWICLTGTDGEQVETSAAELAFVLQYYQEFWGGIPVVLDLKSFRGMYGTTGGK